MDLENSENNINDNSITDDNKTEEISELFQTLPVLNNIFDLHYKVGEGTFSSVYLATLKNSLEKKKFAVKRLVPTCHPARIERELQCLKEIGGKDHVVGLELCLRNLGSVVFIMPYMRHEKFSEYVYNMDGKEMKEYMKALLTALQRVHKFNIIHRDIKPSNFLYDRCNRKYLLVDFGLAQEFDPDEKNMDTSSKSSQNQTNNTKRKKTHENIIDKNNLGVNKQGVNKCYCFGRAKICTLCIIRPPQVAPRAGTPGYRAPEVLLKYAPQTPAIDIWACGVMMLCILSKTQPFFRSPDDLTALAEITSIFGSTLMQQCAKKLGKKLTVSSKVAGEDLVDLCKKLQMRRNSVNEENITEYPLEAYKLLGRLLDPDYKTRITADQALRHSFFD